MPHTIISTSTNVKSRNPLPTSSYVWTPTSISKCNSTTISSNPMHTNTNSCNTSTTVTSVVEK
jgi:hypothetical protein